MRLADFDGDGRPGIVTGWEESGLVCLYLNPGSAKVKQPWPSVIVGREASPEDAVPCDLDGDGRLDIVSCHEGKSKRVLVHWNNAKKDAHSLSRANHWETNEVRKLRGDQWMYALPIDGPDDCTSLVLGSKNTDASITLLAMPKKAGRDLSRSRARKIRDAGWIMSLESIDSLSPASIVMTANTAAQTEKTLPGIWVRNHQQHWMPIDDSTGVKFDRIELVDLDDDGDLDVLTCEERRNLGIVWYENPMISG